MRLLPPEITALMEKLQNHRYSSYLVGGSVRDMIMDRDIKDFDLVTEASPDAVMQLFPQHYPLGLKFGTIVVQTGFYNVEITSFRGIDLAADLARRDFTINAMALDLAGNLYDFYGGREDIAKGLIRAVGCAEARVQEDYLRMIRAVRFACLFEYGFDKALYKNIRRFAENIRFAAPERIRAELDTMLLLPRPSRAFNLLHDLKLLPHILPELDACYGFEQHSRHHGMNVFDHTMMVMDQSPPRLALRLGALFHDIAKPCCFTIDDGGNGHFYGHHVDGAQMTQQALQRLKYDYKTIQTVMLLVENHMSRFDVGDDKAARLLVKKVGQERLDDLFALQTADIEASIPPDDYSYINRLRELCGQVLDSAPALHLQDLAVSGHDLLDVGFLPGPHLGMALNRLLDAVLDDPRQNNRDDLLALARRMLDEGC